MHFCFTNPNYKAAPHSGFPNVRSSRCISSKVTRALCHCLGTVIITRANQLRMVICPTLLRGGSPDSFHQLFWAILREQSIWYGFWIWLVWLLVAIMDFVKVFMSDPPSSASLSSCPPGALTGVQKGVVGDHLVAGKLGRKLPVYLMGGIGIFVWNHKKYVPLLNTKKKC